MSTPQFVEGLYALAYHGTMIYAAKILKTRRSPDGWEYYIHYHKWDAKWDEWVPASRLLADTPENQAVAKANNDSVKAAQAAAKAKPKSAKAKGKEEEAASSSAGAAGVSRKRKLDSSRETEEAAEAPAIKLDLPVSLKKLLVDDWEFISQKRFLFHLARPSASSSSSSSSSSGEGKGASSSPSSSSSSSSSAPTYPTVARICEDYGAWVASGGANEAAAARKAKKGDKEGAAAAAAAAASAGKGDKSGAGGGKGTASAPASSSSSSSSSSSLSSPAAPAPALPSAAAVRAVREVMSAFTSYFDRCLPVQLLYRFERPQLEALLAERAAAGDTRPLAQVYGLPHLLRLLVKLPESLSVAVLTREELDALAAHLGDFTRWLGKHGGGYAGKEHYAKASGAYLAAYEAALNAGAGAAAAGAGAGASSSSSGARAGGGMALTLGSVMYDELPAIAASQTAAAAQAGERQLPVE